MTVRRLAQPWDVAGVDGLVAVRQLFGAAVDDLAPWQSLETELAGEPCSVLRLCDRNFRIAYPGRLDALLAESGLQLWVRRLPWMGAIALGADALPGLAAQATARAPHRLHGLPLHRALPAQIQGVPVVLWHHPHHGQPMVELHLAADAAEAIAALL